MDRAEATTTTPAEQTIAHTHTNQKKKKQQH